MFSPHHSSLAILVLASLAVALLPSPLQSGPRPGGRPSPTRTLTGPQGVLSTTKYRPRIRFETGKAQGSRLPVVATYSTQVGFIDRIEVRIDGKLVDTIRPKAQTSGGTLKATIDLSKAGAGSHKLKLWAWQGRPGYQRLHGESKSFKFSL